LGIAKNQIDFFGCAFVALSDQSEYRGSELREDIRSLREKYGLKEEEL
jgi:hypothetical protein